MKIGDKTLTVRACLAWMEKALMALHQRIGREAHPDWDKLSYNEQCGRTEESWEEIHDLMYAWYYLSVRLKGVGRPKGKRTKLTPENVRRIKKNGRNNITALAKELGVTRQTIHNVLGKKAKPKPEPEPEQPRPKRRKPRRVSYNDALHSPQREE